MLDELDSYIQDPERIAKSYLENAKNKCCGPTPEEQPEPPILTPEAPMTGEKSTTRSQS